MTNSADSQRFHVHRMPTQLLAQRDHQPTERFVTSRLCGARATNSIQKYFPTHKMWSFRQHNSDSVPNRNSTADESIRQKAQDRDGGEEIANNSVLKIGMKNALLRQQAVLSALPEPKRPDRRASEADAQLLSGMRRQQQQLKL
ncbi:MAG: hypothetical protein WC026_04965 [Hyphomicrobium sp.]|uniref:hypothetical protein n=1 Tax=Hyphomicrobium sp. TaxID=82 RepID=UPI0035650048